MKRFLLILSLFSYFSIFSQKEANQWYFGRGAKVDFNTTPPTGSNEGKINTLEGCSSFADEDGNLLFYSDGITVWDQDDNVMNYTNGTPANNLKGDPSSTQSGMIIPKPNSTIYYLFTVDDNGGSGRGLNFYTIDMSLNGNKGELIDENNDGEFFTDLSDGRGSKWSEKVAAVKGKECNTFWVVSIVSNTFYAYKITDSGVDLTPVTSTVNESSSKRGYLKLSPDGSKLAIANQGGFPPSVLYTFNNETGKVNNDGINLTTNADGEAYGVEFSVDSQKLYISTVSDLRRNLSEPPVDYKLFQFDLTQTNITSTKALIHEQVGYRGALQLAPNGKIYATIPLAYNDTNGDAKFLSAIENPTANATDVIFTKEAINLNGGLGTQGLPPFISSLLLPIKITDTNTGNNISSKNLKYCTGNDLLIEPEDTQGTNVSYQWMFDNGTSSFNITDPTNPKKLSLTNLNKTNNGKYILTVNLTNNCGDPVTLESYFNLEVFKTAAATFPSLTPFCDVDNDGFNLFDLKAETEDDILNGQNTSIFEVLYFTQEKDAMDNVTANAITSYTNKTAFTPTPETIYARVHNKNAPNSCYALTQFDIVVTGLPTPQTPTDYILCDDITSGSDVDKTTQNFILASRDAQILGTLDPAIYKVSYHTTKNGAQTSNTLDVIDKNTQKTVTNTETVFVRVENKNNPGCYNAKGELKLIVAPLPQVTSTTLKQCDNNPDLISTFNLTEAEISISNNHVNETFEYYNSENGALKQLNSDKISNIIAYPVNKNGEVWVRTSTKNNCSRVSKIELTVGYSADRAYNETFSSCDDFLDLDGNNTSGSNSDTDGITFFNFEKAKTDIINTFPGAIRADLNVLFYETENNRVQSINEIADIANYRNKNIPNNSGLPFPIFYKIIDKNNNDCTGIGQIFLQVDKTPEANLVNPTATINLCDDFDSGSFVDGKNANIDLTEYKQTILGSQNDTNFDVFFFNTKEGANTGMNPIKNDTNYTNLNANEDSIFVRVVNKKTGCFNAHTSFKFIINPLPTVTNVIPPIEVCDKGTIDNDTRNGLAQKIDLSVRDNDVLNGRDPKIFEVSYHKTEEQAINGTSPLPKKAYSNSPATTTITSNIGQETLYISVLNKYTGCRYGVTTLLIKIFPEPNIEITDISNISICDDDNDGDGTNQLVQNIDLNTKKSEILVKYDTSVHDDFEVSFHTSLNGAETNSQRIPNSQTSTYSNTQSPQRIYVRVRNKDTGCVNDHTFFDIIVNPKPDFEVTTPQIVCLNNTPLTLSVENPKGNYQYVWTKEGETTPLSNTEELEVSVGGTYLVTATNNSLIPACSKELTIVVNESNIAKITDADVTIVDDANNNSISIDKTNLGIGNYEFALFSNEKKQIVRDYQDETIFENLQGGIYTIYVRDKNGCDINGTPVQLEVPVVTFPKFFTPNNDGKNDTWAVKGTNSIFFPSNKIYVFNRQGKQVANIKIDGKGWDGTYNGKPLPSSDYWFVVELTDKNGKQRPPKKGHFSLLRRQ